MRRGLGALTYLLDMSKEDTSNRRILRDYVCLIPHGYLTPYQGVLFFRIRMLDHKCMPIA